MLTAMIYTVLVVTLVTLLHLAEAEREIRKGGGKPSRGKAVTVSNGDIEITLK